MARGCCRAYPGALLVLLTWTLLLLTSGSCCSLAQWHSSSASQALTGQANANAHAAGAGDGRSSGIQASVAPAAHARVQKQADAADDQNAFAQQDSLEHQHQAPLQLDSDSASSPRVDHSPLAADSRSSPDSMTAFQNQPGFRTVVYFVNWAVYGRKHFPADMPIDKLTHILYAFANVNPESGEVTVPDSWSDLEMRYPGERWDEPGTNVYGCTKQLFLLKKRNRNLKLLLSIGGWTYSSNFARPASTPQGRATFARTSVQLLKDRGYDGLDVDWEYPQNDAEARDMVLLLQAVRAELDAYAATLPERPHFLLTIAAPAGKQNYEKLHIAELGQVLDFINLMAYDYAGSWDSTAGHQANLHHSHGNSAATPFCTAAAIQHYIQHGVPAHKMVLGMPLYGRAFQNTKGAGHSYQGIGEGSWEQGIWDYKALPRPGATEHYDEALCASYCYDPNTKTFVSYDTKQAALDKVQYIRQQGLGGAMWWESSGDKQGEESLIAAVHDNLGPIEHYGNQLEYPDSKYDNLKSKFPGDGGC